MFVHPEMLLVLASERHREVIAEADRGRLLTSARLTRRARRAARKASVVRGQPIGTLASCEVSAAVPAR